MKEIELLKIIFKHSPDILEPLNEIDKEIERLNNIIKEALRKLRATKDHYKIEDINNAIIYTIRILERSDKYDNNI